MKTKPQKKAVLRYRVIGGEDKNIALYSIEDRQTGKVVDNFDSGGKAEEICHNLNIQEKTLLVIDALKNNDFKRLQKARRTLDVTPSQEALAAAKEFRATVMGISNTSTTKLAKIIDKHMRGN